MKTSMTILSAIILLEGCSSWPQAGRGGYAEHELLQMRSATAEETNPLLSQLHHEWQIENLRWQLLKVNGASECFPALMYQTEQQKQRTIRTIESELTFDSEVELVSLKKQLNAIAARMDELAENVECKHELQKIVVENEQREEEKDLTALFELLNTSLQFSTASHELLPQYHMQLKHAARVLQQYPEIKIQLVGHADERGTSEFNQGLSNKRAMVVRNVFLENGINDDRILISAQGVNTPVIQGSGEYELLANRRVEIKVWKNDVSKNMKLLPVIVKPETVSAMGSLK